MTALESAWIQFGSELYGDYGDLPPRHGFVKVKCALHLEGRPSAQVNVETGKWRCFAGCGHGDVYDLIGKHEGLTDFIDQKRYAEEHGWHAEDSAPEPTLMNPRPKAKGAKTKWKPKWV